MKQYTTATTCHENKKIELGRQRRTMTVASVYISLYVVIALSTDNWETWQHASSVKQ